MREYIESVINPFVIKHATVMPDGATNLHSVLLIDCWSVHKSAEFMEYLKRYPHLHVVFIPGGTTGLFQPADVAINRPFKHHMKQSFNMWAATSITNALRQDAAAAIRLDITFKSGLKEALAGWAHDAWLYVGGKQGLIEEGWKRCGLDVVVKQDFQMEAMRMQAETGKLFAHFTTLDSNDSPAEPDASPASDAHVDDPAVSASTLVQSMITQWALPAALPAPGTFTRMMMDAILGDLEADEPDQFWAEPEHHIEPMDFLGM
jgi:hypothetical protein